MSEKIEEFQIADFYQRLIQYKLNLPDKSDNEENINFVFIGDEAFSLNKHLLKPFSQRELTYEKEEFSIIGFPKPKMFSV